MASCKILSTARSPLETGVWSDLINIFNFLPDNSIDFFPALTKKGNSFFTIVG